jgi:hypothetical protein
MWGSFPCLLCHLPSLLRLLLAVVVAEDATHMKETIMASAIRNPLYAITTRKKNK